MSFFRSAKRSSTGSSSAETMEALCPTCRMRLRVPIGQVFKCPGCNQQSRVDRPVGGSRSMVASEEEQLRMALALSASAAAQSPGPCWKCSQCTLENEATASRCSAWAWCGCCCGTALAYRGVFFAHPGNSRPIAQRRAPGHPRSHFHKVQPPEAEGHRPPSERVGGR